MVESVSSVEVKRLIKEHKDFLRKFDSYKLKKSECEEHIKNSSERVIREQIDDILNEIPVEEINRNKKGFRIKALKDAGYTTIGSLKDTKDYEIANIYGISDNAALHIKHEVEKIILDVSDGIKVKLNLDKKSKASTSLVLAISRYKKWLKLIEDIQKIEADYRDNIEYAIKDAGPIKNKLLWLFTSKERKQRALDGCERLNELISSDYYLVARDIIDRAEKIMNMQESEAWKRFSDDTVAYVNVLEDIVPDLAGSNDSNYGLPEDLAKEINQECFYPEGLLCELRRYQEMGVKYILHQGKVLLGDEMGLGKTIQAIASMVSLRNTGATHFLVVCPASVISNWCREVQNRSTLKVIKIHGRGRKASIDAWKKTGGVAITTFETTGFFKLEDDYKYDMLIVDEAHYIKNAEARRTINTVDLASHTERLLFMSGTPLENKVEEMIALIKVLQPKVAARLKGMESISIAPQFRESIAPVYYRRKREDVLTELPDLIENEEWCSLLPKEEAMYEKAVLNKKYTEARRVSWNVDNLKDSSKARRMLEIIEEAKKDGRKIIVFSFFLDTISKIKSLLGSQCLEPINGSVPVNKRQEIIDEFDNSPDGTVLLAQIQSGGTGLNIQAANVVILCEPQLKPSIENQAISRAYRMGQKRNVLVYRLLCENSVDVGILEKLEYKQMLFDEFADKSVAANMTDEIDNTTFNDIIQEEINRINKKYNIANDN